ncbi:MAG: hypothetical protein ACRDDC_10720 [Tannerellaceae bacterium]
MELENGLIPIAEELLGFQQYLSVSSRAILSAKFGDGKSTFLNQFMEQNSKKDESNKEHQAYKFFTIYPINYQVADNKDIFEYIKRDLLVQMLSYIELEESTINNSALFVSYLMSHKVDIIGDLLDMIPKINISGIVDVDVKKPFDILIRNIKRFKDYKKNIEGQGQTQILEAYLNSFEGAKGSIYEFDAMSQLICNINKQIKEKEEKDVVLIIEDLDRIDPAHIFRILNILSAHTDRNLVGANEWDATQGENKFSFDKILLVCDFENIRSIFHHFYGKDTDFKGYISKFSSHQPFHYSLKNKYKEFILGLFDADLMDYPNVMDIVADLIIEHQQAEAKLNESSLRSIDSILRREKIIISQEYIALDPSERNKRSDIEGLRVNAQNAFVKVLDLLNQFSIKFELFYTSVVERSCKHELFVLIGACWCLGSSDKFYVSIDTFREELKITNNVTDGYDSRTIPIRAQDREIFYIKITTKFLRDPGNNTQVLESIELIVSELSKFMTGSKFKIDLSRFKLENVEEKT